MRSTLRRLLPILSLALVWVLAGIAGAATGVKRPFSAFPSAETAVAEQQAPVLGTLPRVVEALEGRAVDQVEPERLRTCVLNPEVVAGVDGELSLAVATSDGELMLGLRESLLVAPASVVKLFTAVAALRALGPDFRFRTTVIQGPNTGEVWLVGGGDVTLTRSASNNYYDSDASLADLAQQTVDRLAIQDITPTDVYVDTSRYADFPLWDESWRQGSERLGFIAPVAALQVDADRDQPAVRLSPRSSDPVARALGWFADDLYRDTGQYPSVQGRAPAPEGRVLAMVESAPLTELVAVMLRDSDNSLAEVIAREVALATGASSLGNAVLEAVGLPEVALGEAQIHDGSGLSDLTALSSTAVVDLLGEVSASDDLAVVRDGLPIASQTGSLRNRFVSVASELDGRVRAKTGSLRGVRSLAGFIAANDGQEVVFSVVLSGPQVTNDTRDDIDRIVADLARCGENLARWD